MEYQTLDTMAATESLARFTVDRGALLKAIGLMTRKIVETKRRSIPILSNLAFDVAPDGAATVIGTDLDLQAVASFQCRVDAPGRFTVDAAMIFDAIRKMPENSQVSVRDTGDRVEISAGRAAMKLQRLPFDDFPIIACPAWDASFTLSAETLARDLAALRPAISTEETRYYLNGVALEIRQGRMFMVATNGNNLACVDRVAPETVQGVADSIIPRKAVAALLDALKGMSGPLSVKISGSKIRLDLGDLVITSKLIDGTFPDWRMILADAEFSPCPTPGADPRLPVDVFAKMEKAAGCPLSVDKGDRFSLLTSPDYPEYFALSTHLERDRAMPVAAVERIAPAYVAPEGQARDLYDITPAGVYRHGTGYSATFESIGIHPGPRKARREEWEAYARDYATRCGMDVRDMDVSGYSDNGPCTIAHFGEVVTASRCETVERLNWETLAVEYERVFVPAEYQEGSFSLALPGHKQAPVTISVDGGGPVILPDWGNDKENAAALTRIMGLDVRERTRKAKPVKERKTRQVYTPSEAIDTPAPVSVESAPILSPPECIADALATWESEGGACPSAPRLARPVMAIEPMGSAETVSDRELQDWQAFMMARFGELERKIDALAGPNQSVAPESETPPSEEIQPVPAWPGAKAWHAERDAAARVKHRSPAHLRAIRAYLAMREQRNYFRDNLRRHVNRAIGSASHELERLSKVIDRLANMRRLGIATYLAARKARAVNADKMARARQERDDAWKDVRTYQDMANRLGGEAHQSKAKRRRAILLARDFQKRLYREYKMVDRAKASERKAWQGPIDFARRAKHFERQCGEMGELLGQARAEIARLKIVPTYIDTDAHEHRDAIAVAVERVNVQTARADALSRELETSRATVAAMQTRIDELADKMMDATGRALRAETALSAVTAKANGWPPAVRSVNVAFANAA